MPVDDARRQVELEQTRVSTMYQQLDHLGRAARTELADVLASPAADPAEARARDQAASRLSRRLHQLSAAEHSLCFGRVDGTDGTVLHVGRLGIRTDDRELPLLVDWRAEAARPFYTATSLSPLGLRRRRHLRVDGRTVCGVSDELLDGSAPTADDVVDDGPLAEALAAQRTGRMREAVATLQSEQDAIVRSADRGITVVQGAPGTGKTVVALHRAAYVLYAFAPAAEDGVLVLGPNSRFLDYISQVLPSLGENDVVLATCEDLAGVGPGAAEPAAGSRLKGRPELAGALTGLVRSQRSLTGAFVVRVGSESIRLDRTVVAEAGTRADGSGLAHNPARAVFKEYLLDVLAATLERRATEAMDRIDADVAELTGLDLDRAAAADLRSLGLDDRPAGDPGEGFDYDAMRAGLQDDPRVDRAIGELWPTLDAADVVHRLLTDPHAIRAHLPARSGVDWTGLLRAADAAWTDADLPLLDEVESLVNGEARHVYGHVVVDEAQELTAMQWRMVMRRCPSKSMTVVGDFAQAGPSSTLDSWSDALGPHVGARFALNTLTVNYRTTQEILDATGDLLAAISPDQPPSRSIRHGDLPARRTARRDELVDALRAELRAQVAAYPGELTAVICSDPTEHGLTDTDVADAARVVPVSGVRGLEFDSVIVVGPDEIRTARSSGDRDLYVALTRATKRLCIVDIAD